MEIFLDLTKPEQTPHVKNQGFLSTIENLHSQSAKNYEIILATFKTISFEVFSVEYKTEGFVMNKRCLFYFLFKTVMRVEGNL